MAGSGLPYLGGILNLLHRAVCMLQRIWHCGSGGNDGCAILLIQPLVEDLHV